MSQLLTVSEIARELTTKIGQVVRPRDISTLFYDRRLADDACPIVGGNRLIPRSYLPEVEAALLRHGALALPTSEVQR